MRRRIVVLIVFLFTSLAWAQDDERILQYDSDISVQADSSLDLIFIHRARLQFGQWR